VTLTVVASGENISMMLFAFVLLVLCNIPAIAERYATTGSSSHAVDSSNFANSSQIYVVAGNSSNFANLAYDAFVLTRSSGPAYEPRSDDPFSDSMQALVAFDKSVSADCSELYGMKMIQKIQGTNHTVCSGKGGKSSSVVCHERVPFDDVPRYICELHHVQVSSDTTVLESCEKTDWAKTAKFGVTEKKYLEQFQSQESLACEFSSRKTLLQAPWDTNNFYEWLGDWITLWETLAALQWNPKDVDIFLVVKPEALAKRPFDDAWKTAFSSMDAVHAGSRGELFGQGKCFAHLAIVPHGGLSTTTFHGGRGGTVSCASPALMSSAIYLERLFPSKSPAAKPQTKQVTLILRAGSRAFGEEEVNAVAQVLPSGWSLKTCRLEDLKTLNEQLEVAQETQVLVGAHGAGLTTAMFLPPQARLVEIWCGDRGPENHHYMNLEVMSDQKSFLAPHRFHFGVPEYGECQLDKDEVKKAIKEAVAAYEADASATV